MMSLCCVFLYVHSPVASKLNSNDALRYLGFSVYVDIQTTVKALTRANALANLSLQPKTSSYSIIHNQHTDRSTLRCACLKHFAIK